MNLLPPLRLFRITRTAVILLSGILLSACASKLPVLEISDNSSHSAALRALNSWTISGRLNIRQSGQSDTVCLNWQQRQSAFDIEMRSCTLGLGSTRISGDTRQAVLEKSGEEPLLLAGLDELSADYLGYDFPAAHLLWWIRGLAVPGLTGSSTVDDNGLLSTLTQTSPAGQHWSLQYDRYQQTGELVLPGRIRVDSQGVRLTFLIDDWLTGGTADD